MRTHGNTRGISRRSMLATGSAAIGLSALAAPAVLAQQKFVCRMGHSEAIGSPLTMAFEAWGKAMNEKSGGRIDAQHFPASQLGSYTQMIEQNRLGTIQATTGGPDTEESVAPEIAATGGAPGFIYRDEAHVDRVLQGDIGKEVSRIAREKTGVEFIAFGEVGFRHILSKRPVLTMADARGLKIRTPEVKLWVDFWRAVGSSPTPLPYAEQYSALSTGLIDALESDVFSIVGFKWQEQAKHLTLTSHWFLPKAVRVNARWLDSLPADLQALVRTSALEAFAEQRRVNRANTAATLEELKASGITVRTAGDTAAWRAATEPLFAEFASKSPATKAMIDKIRGLVA
ncbi:MAG: TRAP transporter substrate-binding protein [Alphaproteobacteria bacterium]|nr:TRAP transporter substrate-binding protein [Alphaproteobacteria bacterium]